jgi:hypothetical protein
LSRPPSPAVTGGSWPGRRSWSRRPSSPIRSSPSRWSCRPLATSRAVTAATCSSPTPPTACCSSAGVARPRVQGRQAARAQGLDARLLLPRHAAAVRSRRPVQIWTAVAGVLRRIPPAPLLVIQSHTGDGPVAAALRRANDQAGLGVQQSPVTQRGSCTAAETLPTQPSGSPKSTLPTWHGVGGS